MRRSREVLLANGWQLRPTTNGWYWVAGPGRQMRPAFVKLIGGVGWWVTGGGGGGPLRRRLVYPCTIPPGVRIPKDKVQP